ncbi:MAG: hypothetical protein WAL47_13320, partial [Pyrinomonadaceae bacterium]
VWRFTATLKGGSEIVTFLLPRTAEVKWKVAEIETSRGRAFEVSVGKTRDLVMIRGGEWVWQRFIEDQLQETVSLQPETNVRH